MITNKIRYPIVKPVLPNKTKYTQLIDGIYDRNWLTNNGPLLQELEYKLADYLGVKHLMLVSNGTLALHLAYKALTVTGEVVTTPFSFAATASSISWEGHSPHFVDINGKSLNIDSEAIAKTKSASAIVAVHVFGNPCEVEAIDEIAQLNNQSVIYDAAHAFGSDYKGKSVLNYGDASTLSLHATKMIHCVEGGAIIFKAKEKLELAKQMINFGFDADNMPSVIGINAKMSEMHAAMGLATLEMVDDIIEHRQHLIAEYQKQLFDVVEFQQWHPQGKNNGAYMPVILRSEQELLHVMKVLSAAGIQSRRYFYPSLSQVSIYGQQGTTPIANDISLRILCLPMYFNLTLADVVVICDVVKRALRG